MNRCMALLMSLCAATPVAHGSDAPARADGSTAQTRPATTRPAAERSTLRLEQRRREAAAAGEPFRVNERNVEWDGRETALILCDVWNEHWCKGATTRVNALVPRIDALAKAVRASGGLVVHAPSDTLAFYKDTPQRRRAMEAPPVEPPSPGGGWVHRDEKVEPPLPIDDSDGGCDCLPPCKTAIVWKRQHPGIEVAAGDAVSESGREIYNLFRQRGIKHVLIAGVHTNMCVLGRSFGIRQMVLWRMDVALVRDLTDTMYNPRKAPFVAHDQGTERVIEHIEKYWCPTIASEQIVRRK